MTFRRIPQEITDLIIEEVSRLNDSDDIIKDLTACSFICKSFRHQAQKCIFRQVELSSRSDRSYEEDGCERIKSDSVYRGFHNALSSSPALANYVRGLQIVDIEYMYSTYPTFLKVLAMLRRVRTFSLCVSGQNQKPCDWRCLNPDIRQAVKGIILRPGLERHFISNHVNLPTAATQWLCTITSFRMKGVTFEDSVDINLPTTPMTTSYQCRMKYLEVAHSAYSEISPFITMLSSSKCALEKLVIEDNYSLDLMLAQEVIQVISSSLISLEHPSPFDREGTLSPVSLRNLNNLKTIQIEIASPQCVEGARRLLDTVSSTNTLQTLKLKLQAGNVSDWVNSDIDRDLDAHDVLLSGEKFKIMKVIVFVDPLRVEDEEGLDDFREAFTPNPFAKGIKYKHFFNIVSCHSALTNHVRKLEIVDIESGVLRSTLGRVDGMNSP